MDKEIHIDRELSWIKFNKRVLEEAFNKNNPLMERLNFVSIFQSNYEEFFRVRVGSCIDKLLIEKKQGRIKNQLAEIYAATSELLPQLDKAYNGILEDGAKYFEIVDEADITPAEHSYLKQIFEKSIGPVISPFIIEKNHPFPFFDNSKHVIGVTLKTKGGNTKFGLIPMRDSLPKAVALPGKKTRIILIENLILMFAHKVFHRFEITEKIIFSIIRNADIDENEGLYDFEVDFRETMSKLIELRRRLAPVELRYIGTNCDKILAHLKKMLCLSKKQLFRQSAPLGTKFVSVIENRLPKSKYPELYYKPVSSQYPSFAKDESSLIDVILKKDRLLSYPFDDIKFLIDLLDEAAKDSRVTEIMITLYRVANDSKIVQALIDASRAGKKVTCMVELRARFDEENNIDWSKRLENAGCRVIYGLPDYKVHSKLLVIGLKDGKSVVQVGTGNFNEKTARLYTDLALFTSNPEIAKEARYVFDCLNKGVFVENSEKLMVAPLCLKQKLIALIDEQIERQSSGEKGEIILKMNSLTDKDLINKLAEASMAGVKIQMIIRGICCLVPGIAGKTDNIKVISIVGRFLEHSRIYAFGDYKTRKYFISSADFMTRNTMQRVEVAAPVYDYNAKLKLAKILKLSLSDNCQARKMKNNGEYVKVCKAANSAKHNMQEELFELAYAESNNKTKTKTKGKK